MDKREAVIDFNENLERVIDFKDKELINRSEWGEINFKPYSFTFEKLWNTIGHLESLPVEFLSDTVLSKSSAKLDEIINDLQNIDEFKIAGTNNPENQRNSYGKVLTNKVDEFNSIIAVWIPFLAYQQGDVSENISKLKSAIENTEAELENSKKTAHKKLKDIEKVSEQAKEAAATAGASVFTQEFGNEAETQLKEANNWLYSTIALAVITALTAVIVLIITLKGYDTGNVWQFISAKITLFILLFTATVWSGKIYKSIKHQSVINKHRSLGLKTFQAFSHAASDSQTKNAVLLETTRSIFSNFPTGLVDSKHSKGESDIRIIEMLNSVTKSDSN